MSDFKYLGCQSSKNKRHFISERVFLFRYVGDKKYYTDIVKELGSLFAFQSFAPFEVINREGRYSIQIVAKGKVINISVYIADYRRAVVKSLYYIGVSYNHLGSKFKDERLKLEEILEKTCKGVAGKVA